MGHVERLEMSSSQPAGGAIDVPWRIATALRAAADEWNMLIPFRANSAATLLALGADEIVAWVGKGEDLSTQSWVSSASLPAPGGGQGTPVRGQRER